MTSTVKKPKTPLLTAVSKLELSKIDPNQIQKELMGDDLDLDKLNVYLASTVLYDTSARVIDIKVNRTIDGASTIDLVSNDYDRTLLRSGALNARLDIEIDGLWFRLVKVSRDAGSDEITLTFEQREIAILRTYPKPGASHYGVKWASREHVTRAEFILNLIREVQEFRIPVVIPHLHQVQQVELPQQKQSDTWGSQNTKGSNSAGNTGSGGIPPDINKSKVPEKAQEKGVVPVTAITVKGVLIAKDQRNNANTILQVGSDLGANRKVLVCAIMTAIQESTLHNLAGGDGTSVGLFQQIDTGWGSYADRHDPPTASRMFFQHAIPYEASHPGETYGSICQGVQNSKYPYAYQPHFDEANRIVSAFGIPWGTDASGGAGGAGIEATAADANLMANNTAQDNAYYFMRGVKDQSGNFVREDSWTCIRRLADEVGWRAFFISGTFYYPRSVDRIVQPLNWSVSVATLGGVGWRQDGGFLAFLHLGSDGLDLGQDLT